MARSRPAPLPRIASQTAKTVVPVGRLCLNLPLASSSRLHNFSKQATLQKSMLDQISAIKQQLRHAERHTAATPPPPPPAAPHRCGRAGGAAGVATGRAASAGAVVQPRAVRRAGGAGLADSTDSAPAAAGASRAPRGAAPHGLRALSALASDDFGNLGSDGASSCASASNCGDGAVLFSGLQRLRLSAEGSEGAVEADFHLTISPTRRHGDGRRPRDCQQARSSGGGGRQPPRHEAGRERASLCGSVGSGAGVEGWPASGVHSASQHRPQQQQPMAAALAAALPPQQQQQQQHEQEQQQQRSEWWGSSGGRVEQRAASQSPRGVASPRCPVSRLQEQEHAPLRIPQPQPQPQPASPRQHSLAPHLQQQHQGPPEATRLQPHRYAADNSEPYSLPASAEPSASALPDAGSMAASAAAGAGAALGAGGAAGSPVLAAARHTLQNLRAGLLPSAKSSGGSSGGGANGAPPPVHAGDGLLSPPSTGPKAPRPAEARSGGGGGLVPALFAPLAAAASSSGVGPAELISAYRGPSRLAPAAAAAAPPASALPQRQMRLPPQQQVSLLGPGEQRQREEGEQQAGAGGGGGVDALLRKLMEGEPTLEDLAGLEASL